MERSGMRVSLHAIVRQHLPAFLRLNNDLDIKTVLAFNTKSPKILDEVVPI